MNKALKSVLPQNGLGRLKALGPSEPWQVAFLLPVSWDDLRNARRDFAPAEFREGEDVVLAGRAVRATVNRDGRAPRLTAYLRDAAGYEIGFTFFGDLRPLSRKSDLIRLC